MNAIVQQILSEFDLGDFRPIYPRDLDLGEPFAPRAGNLVKIVTGIRRAGKSYRLFQEMDRLIAKGVPPERICYFNFEDDRLGDVTPATGDDVLEAFFARSPEALLEGCYLFLDEIQQMAGWDRWMRRVVDTTKATIYVTGSSSKLLSSDIATGFRGRSIEFALYPYSFAEYLRIADPATHEACRREGGAHSQGTRLICQRLLGQYLERGGFPQAMGLPLSQMVSLLQGYGRRVLFQDVVERHDVSRPRVAERIMGRLLAMNCCVLSVRALVNELRSLSLNTSRDYVETLIGFFEDAYLVGRLQRFTRKLSPQASDLPKVYAVDPGLAMAMSPARPADPSLALENVIYLELVRRVGGTRSDSVSYWRSQGRGYEVDFVAGDPELGDAEALYQVTWELEGPRTVEREARSLVYALDDAGMRGSELPEAHLIIGRATPKVIEQVKGYLEELGGNARRIRPVSAVDWLLI